MIDLDENYLAGKYGPAAAIETAPETGTENEPPAVPEGNRRGRLRRARLGPWLPTAPSSPPPSLHAPVGPRAMDLGRSTVGRVPFGEAPGRGEPASIPACAKRERTAFRRSAATTLIGILEVLACDFCF